MCVRRGLSTRTRPAEPTYHPSTHPPISAQQSHPLTNQRSLSTHFCRASRDGQDWRAALRVLEAVEREAEAAVAARAGPGSWPHRQGRVWCREGLASREDDERARAAVYNIVLEVLSARTRCAFLVDTVRFFGSIAVSIDRITRS